MNFPILSFLTFFPLVGVIFILLRRGTDEVVERSSKNISILISIINYKINCSNYESKWKTNAGPKKTNKYLYTDVNPI